MYIANSKNANKYQKMQLNKISQKQIHYKLAIEIRNSSMCTIRRQVIFKSKKNIIKFIDVGQ